MRVEDYSFAKIFDLYVKKAERKERTSDEVMEIVSWFSGYSLEAIQDLLDSPMTLSQFFDQAPSLNVNRHLITGKVCGVDVTTIEDPFMQNVRYLDKLIDELAKGKKMEKILRQ